MTSEIWLYRCQNFPTDCRVTEERCKLCRIIAVNIVAHNLLYEKITGSSLHELMMKCGDSPQLKYEGDLAYWLQNDKLYPVQSKRNPEREANNLAEHWFPAVDSKPMVVALLGVSSLYIIEALLNRLPQDSHIILVDPNPQHMKSFIDNCGGHEIFREDRLHLITANSDHSLSNTFRKKISMQNTLCSRILSLPSISRLRPELETSKQLLSQVIKIEAMDRGTNAAFSAEWLQNSIINMPEMLKAPGIIQLHNKFKDQDALVVCAGPSLNESLDYIKKYQDTALIICVGTALKPLLAAGISPHITMIVDSDPKVNQQFTGLDNPPGYLMCPYTIFPGIIQKYSQKIIAFNCLVTAGFSKWLKNADINHGTLNIGGTVSLSALDLAKACGAKNIFTFGLDLAYAADGTSHAKNSMYDAQTKTKGLVEVQGNRHNTVKTTKQFAGYIDIMNRYLKENFSGLSGKIYNVNNHGAKLAVMDLITPEELPKHITESSSSPNIAACLESNQISDSSVEDLINETVKEINTLKQESEALLDQFHGNNIPAGIEHFEEKVKNSDVCSNLLDQAMRAWSMQVTNGGISDPVELTRSFVKQIHGASDWVSGMLERSQNRLKQQQGV